VKNGLRQRLRLAAGLRSYFEFYAEYAQWNRRLLTEGLGIDPGFEERQAVLNRTLADAFAPTFHELGIRDHALAGFALIGMAGQLAYWNQFPSEGQSIKDVETLSQTCARFFLTGAPSISHKGDSHA